MTSYRRLFFLLLCCTSSAFAQQRAPAYVNQVYQNYIKTVQCYNKKKEQSLPLIPLRSGEQIHFSFDDLEAGHKNYRYEVEHCNADWRSSALSPSDYVLSFTGGSLLDDQYSSGTSQKYTHYQLTLPNEQLQFKIPGNYVLKVYDERHPQTPVITQRLLVINPLVELKATLSTSSLLQQRDSHQKLNISMVYPEAVITDPAWELKLVVMQNANPATAVLAASPSMLRPGLLEYRGQHSLTFSGGNEFRRVDLRISLQSLYRIQDTERGLGSYSKQTDDNGAFLIRSLTGKDPQTENDYLPVRFTLTSPQPDTSGQLYVVGAFNQYACDERSQLTYDAASKSYQLHTLLKQGIYDYQYVWKTSPAEPADHQRFEGNYFETSNSYQLLVYYKKAGNRWEELCGYLSIQTDTLPALQ